MAGKKYLQQSDLLLSIALYLAGVMYLFPHLRFYLDNPDTFSYIAVAEKYSSGDFYGAINSTWSPLISWLLSLFMLTGIDSILLFKVLQAVLGCGGLWLTSVLIDRFKMTMAHSFLLKVSLVPFFLSCSLLLCSPDLLFLILLIALHVLFLKKNALGLSNSARIGLTGALLYFCKAYGIFYFLVLCLFFYSLQFFRGKEKLVRPSAAISFTVSLSVFAILSLAWIATISLKYNRFTINDAVGYNFLTMTDPSQRATVPHPIISNGLLDPAKNGSLFAWEDPAYYTKGINTVYENWNARVRIRVFQTNLLSLYYYQYRHQIGSLFILSCFIFILRFRKKIVDLVFTLCVFSSIVFPAGYLVIYLAPRYIWVLSVLMAIVIFFIADRFATAKNFLISIPLAILCFILLVKRPVKEILWREDIEKSSIELVRGISHPQNTLKQTYAIDRLVFTMADSLSKRTDLEGNAASLFYPAGSSRDSYSLTLFLCHRLGNVYFGQVADTALQTRGVKPLLDNAIRFFYVWGNPPASKDSLRKFPVTFYNKETGLRIYRLSP